MHECLNLPNISATIVYIHNVKIRVRPLPDGTLCVIANVYICMFTLHVNACPKAYIYNVSWHMYITLSLLLLPPYFDVKAPIFTSPWLKIQHALSWPPMNVHGFDSLWTDCLWMHVVFLWLFIEGSIFGGKMDFIMDLFIDDAFIIHYHMNPLGLVVLGWSYFTHADFMVIHCWIWVIMQKYYSCGGTNCLELCLTVWRSSRLYAECCPLLWHCHHRQHIHSYSKVSIFLLLFFQNTQFLGPVAHLPLLCKDYLWPTRLPMLHFCIFVPVWFYILGTVGLSISALSCYGPLLRVFLLLLSALCLLLLLCCIYGP